MKRLLVFDTASDQLALGLATLERSGDSATSFSITMEAEINELCRRQANKELLPKAQELLKNCSLTFSDVDVFAVGRGPGSFTGVRIGIATAKGLASACNKPLLGASTLDAIAYRAWLQGMRGPLGVVADAMRGEVYPGLYCLDEAGVSREFGVETVLKTKTCITQWQAQHLCTVPLTGDGLNKYQEDFEAAGFSNILDHKLWTPTAEALVYSALKNNQPLLLDDAPSVEKNPQLILPVYTRLSDAEEHELEELGKKRPAQMSASGVAEEEGVQAYQYRPMQASDIQEVVQLEAAGALTGTSSHTPYSAELFYASLHPSSEHLKTSWWVALNAGEIIGFAGAQLTGACFEILDVAVAEMHQREGVATKLLSRVTYDGQMLGASRASLEVFENNDGALALYYKLGFEEKGRRPNYYGTDKDALYMEAALPLALPSSEQEPQPKRTNLVWPQQEEPRTSQTETALEAAGNLILAIETSCDETAMAIIDAHGTLIANVVSTQIDFHARFGGVVPEIASRKHTEALCLVLQETLEEAGHHFGCERLSVSDLSAVAVTKGPGLVGALVVGIAFAKGLAAGASLKLIGVNHLEGHLFANLIENPQLWPPFVASLVSGGNTMLVEVRDWGNYNVLGSTIDDAVGEAFDKVAKALGLGYPGGPIISRLAEKGNPKAIDFPRALLHSHDYRFSLSGLKTAVVTYLEKQEKAGALIHKNDVAASFQAAVIDVLVAKAVAAAKECNVRDFCVGGGVAANPALRKAYEEALRAHGVRLTVPPLHACTDNAAMIALVAQRVYKERKENQDREGYYKQSKEQRDKQCLHLVGHFDDLSMDANPNLSL